MMNLIRIYFKVIENTDILACEIHLMLFSLLKNEIFFI